MSVVRHLMATLFRTLLGVIVALVLGGAAGAGLTLLVAFSQTQQWPPQGLTTSAAIAIGVLTALLGALLVLMRAAVHGLLATGKIALGEAARPVVLAADAIKAVEKIEHH